MMIFCQVLKEIGEQYGTLGMQRTPLSLRFTIEPKIRKFEKEAKITLQRKLKQGFKFCPCLNLNEID
jgi:hypothetical protein